MPLGLEVGSSPWPHSLVLCHSLWSTPVSIPHAFNILYMLSKPLSSWLMYSNDLVFSLNSATILWSQLRTELSTWGWWMDSRCAEMWTPSAPGAATGWSTSSQTTHPRFFHCAKQMWLFSKCSLRLVACHYRWLYHLWNLGFRHPYFHLCSQTSNTPPTPQSAGPPLTMKMTHGHRGGWNK